MRGRIAALLVISALAGGCTRPGAKTVEWEGHFLKEARSLYEMPGALQSALGVGRSGLEGVADRGRPYNVTDVVDPSLPMRRLLAAGGDSAVWIVALERGGRAYSVEVFEFAPLEPTPKQTWILNNRPKTFEQVLRNISRRV